MLRVLFRKTRQFFNLRYWAMLWLFVRYGGRRRYRAGTMRIARFRLRVPDAWSVLFQYREIYVREYYRFRTSNPSPVIYDCGANVGMSALYFKQLYPKARIKAFEADSMVAAALQHNLATNGAQDVEVIAKAVWTHDQGVEMALEGADGGSIFQDGTKTLIPSVRLHDYLSQEAHVDMLKMDIEGAETAVILDCAEVLPKIDHIFIEYHAYISAPQSLAEILALLQAKGFRYFLKNDRDRNMPFVQREYEKGYSMDLQMNIFAYKE